MQTTDIQQEQDIYTVSRLNNEVRFLLEDSFPVVWVEGEISNFAAPGSGHWYFSLKDPSAQVRCAMFRGNQRRLGFTPKDGMHVLIKARVSLYTNRGEYQLLAEQMEERGEGKLRRAFELLKKKLEAEGLFDPAHKKNLPAYPRQIGVITSPTGAAVRDILTVLKRRYPCASVIIYPTLVQGDTAAATIVQAIKAANRRNECDILIVTRGGGSLEDLWPFNEEIVARAIYQSRLPIISGVGHEIDFTIADFVADQRAPTPSAAAEIATPDRVELLRTLSLKEKQITRHAQAKLTASRQQLHWIQKHLYQLHPKRRLTEKMQRLDFTESALSQFINRFLDKQENRLNEQNAHLLRLTPLHRIRQVRDLITLRQKQLYTLITTALTQNKTRLSNASGKLDALSPLATLQRGYAIATARNQQIIRSTADVGRGDEIQVQLADGKLKCLVE